VLSLDRLLATRKRTIEIEVYYAGSERDYADGFGSAAKFAVPEGITIDAAGNLYVADSGNNRIRHLFFVNDRSSR